MSNVTLFNASNVPAFARNNELSDTAKALTGGGTGQSVKRISIKGGVFRLVAGSKEMASIDERFLDVIIIKAAPKVSRIFYAKSYDAEAIVGPDCWSNDGEKPDSTIKDAQSQTCMACPQNIAGSGQGNSRACRFQQRMAVVLESSPTGDVLQLVLPATSIFGKEEGDKRPLQAYARYLALQSPPINPEQIVTRMRFDTKAESPKLHFQPVRWLEPEEYETVLSQAESPEAQRAIVMTVAQMDGVKAKAAPLAIPGKNPVAAAPAATPEPVEAADDSTDDEPEVRKAPAKGAAVPAKKSKLADIVSDWDDE